jgi:predicted  nucleic acid-binding Zn-ribbon protein
MEEEDMNQALNALYKLQEVDSALALAYKRYNALDKGAAELAATESARALHERTATELHDTTRDLHDAELELKTLEEHKTAFEKKLNSGRVTNWKELQDLQEEIDALGRQRSKLDERILTLMDQLEGHRAAEADAAAKLKAAEEALAAKQASYKVEGRKLAVRIQQLTAQREELAKPVAPGLMGRYEAIRKSKGGVGIAKLVGNDCGACHTSLPSGVVKRVEDTDGIEVCENCGRMLCIGD